MFRPMDPQRKLFDAAGLLTPEIREECKRSWAGPWRQKALPILREVENLFADLFHPEHGRPNCPVPLVLGAFLLKDIDNLTDDEVLDRLHFDVRAWFAFELAPHEIGLCRKTLHNFQTRLLKKKKEKLAFLEVTKRLQSALGLSVERQRLDSKHIVSNMAILGRLGLMCETIRVFLAALKGVDPKAYEAVSAPIRERYGEHSRYADARRSEGQRRLGQVAQDLWGLLQEFGAHPAVTEMKPWGLLKRVFEEQCEVVAPEAAAPRPGKDNEGDGPAPAISRPEGSEDEAHEPAKASAGAGPSPAPAESAAPPPRSPAPPPATSTAPKEGEVTGPVRLKPSKEISSASLQSPHDPDATYSGHKGKGYSVQIAETCGNGKKPELITHVEVTRACDSDAKATVPVVEALEAAGRKPKELVADTAYSSGENAARLAAKGVNLLAPAPGPAKPKPGRVYEAPAPQCSKDPAEATKWLTAQEAAPDFPSRYAIRAGSEGTNSELARAHGLSKLRVRGEKRVKPSAYFKALACNVKRAIGYWLQQALGAKRAAVPA